MTGVAIVIPMLNEAAGLPRLLRSLAALEPTLLGELLQQAHAEEARRIGNPGLLCPQLETAPKAAA